MLRSYAENIELTTTASGVEALLLLTETKPNGMLIDLHHARDGWAGSRAPHASARRLRRGEGDHDDCARFNAGHCRFIRRRRNRMSREAAEHADDSGMLRHWVGVWPLQSTRKSLREGCRHWKAPLSALGDCRTPEVRSLSRMATSSRPEVNHPRGDPASPEQTYARLDAFTYLTAPEVATYVAIMRIFTRSLLTDFAAADLASRLAATGITIDPDAVESRLQKLVTWGNLLPSPREIRVTSIAEYQRQRARYQLSKLGGQVHEHAEAILAATDGVQEITRELLGIVARELTRLAEIATQPGGLQGADTTTIAEHVSTTFVSFASFASQIRDFYASIGNVLARFDLSAGEYNGFKQVLLDYLDIVNEDIDRFSPGIEAVLSRLAPFIVDIVARLDDPHFRALAGSNGTIGVDRAPGRSVADWDELRRWFDPIEPTAGVRELRAATSRALAALLANLKRLNAASLGDSSLRRDLLRLATWFEGAEADVAHALYDATFAMHSARHLSGWPPDGEVPATTSWWKGPIVDVPVSLREHGDRTPRGRHTPAADHSEQRARLLADRAAEDERRSAAAAELLAVGDRLAAVVLSAGALSILAGLLANALAATVPSEAEAEGTAPATGLKCTFFRHAGLTTVIRSTVGDLTISGGRVTIAASTEAQAGDRA